jgi:hypothetical protein
MNNWSGMLAAPDPNGYDSEDEFIWKGPSSKITDTSLGAGLIEFEKTLKCLICQQFLVIPVSPKDCGHTFCSECIRSAITASMKIRQKADCPQCRGAIDARTLIPNTGLAAVVSKFKDVRKGLHSNLISKKAADDDVDQQQQQKKGAKKQTSKQQKKAKGSEEPARASTRTRRATQSSQEYDYDDDGGDDHDDGGGGRDDDADFVDLSGASPQQPPQPQHHQHHQQQQQSASLPWRAPPYYHGMKKKGLVELCAKDFLSTKGSDTDLTSRHTLFMTLYRAEYDCKGEMMIGGGRGQRTVREIAEEVG